MTMTHHTDEIQPIADGLWRIHAERSQGTYAATGEATVREAGPAHGALAGARAWLALAQVRQAASDSETAITSARAGLDELGQRYYERSLGVIDDTGMQVSLANEQLKRGQAEQAARRLIAALEYRLKLYIQLHAQALAE
jgi:hypothetical protein